MCSSRRLRYLHRIGADEGDTVIIRKEYIISMEDCIFCKIISGAIPCMKIYEDEYTLAFLDIARDVDGHILVIPKVHVTSIYDCNTDTLHHLMDTVKKVSVHCIHSCGYEGVNLLNASGISAGQSVPHFHIHLIPRKADDSIDAWPQFHGGEKSLEEMFDKLKMEF